MYGQQAGIARWRILRLMADFESHWIDDFDSAEEWLDHCEDKYTKWEAEREENGSVSRNGRTYWSD